MWCISNLDKNKAISHHLSLFKTFSWYFKGSKEQHVVPEIPYSHERKKAFKTTISKLKFFYKDSLF
jgi:hypothetical protein